MPIFIVFAENWLAGWPQMQVRLKKLSLCPTKSNDCRDNNSLHWYSVVIIVFAFLVRAEEAVVSVYVWKR